MASISPLTLWAVVTYGDFLDSATWMEAGPQGMKLASLRSRMRWRDLCTWKCCTSTVGSWCPHLFKNQKPPPPQGLPWTPYLRWVDLALNDVEYGDVAVCKVLVDGGGHHHVLGLQQPPHHVQHGCLAHVGGMVRICCQWSVAAKEKKVATISSKMACTYPSSLTQS